MGLIDKLNKKILGTPSIEEMKANNDINGLLAEFENEDPAKRGDAVEALAEIIAPDEGTIDLDEAFSCEGSARENLHDSTDILCAVGETGGIGISTMQDVYYLIKGKHKEKAIQQRKEKTKEYEQTIIPFLQALEDSDTKVKQNAALALMRIGDHRATSGFREFLKQEKDPLARSRAIRALSYIADKQALDPLLEILNNGESGETLLVLQSLKIIGDKRAVEPLITFLGNTNHSSIRSLIVSVLAKLDDDRAVEPIITILKHDEEARWRAIKALGELNDKRAVEPLIAALDDRRPDIRENAILVLGKFEDLRAVEPIIAILKNDENQDVRRKAIEALETMGDTRAIVPLSTIAVSESELTTKSINALESIGEAAVDSLIDLLESEDQKITEKAIFALESIGDKRAGDAIVSFLRTNEEPELRNTALFALKTLANRNVASSLLEFIKDPEEDENVRNHSIEIYVNQLGIEALGPLSEVLEKEEDLWFLEESVKDLKKKKTTKAIQESLKKN